MIIEEVNVYQRINIGDLFITWELNKTIENYKEGNWYIFKIVNIIDKNAIICDYVTGCEQNNLHQKNRNSRRIEIWESIYDIHKSLERKTIYKILSYKPIKKSPKSRLSFI